MPGNPRNKESQPTKDTEGLPFVPVEWPHLKRFQAEFAKTVARRRIERELGIDEDGSSLANPYAITDWRDRRFTPRRPSGIDNED